MSILSATGKIIMVQEPVSGRFGLQKLLAKLSSNAYGVNWNGSDEISLVTRSYMSMILVWIVLRGS